MFFAARSIFSKFMPPSRYLSEGPVDYGNYRFSYCLWMESSPEAVPDTAYETGFLPYSADPDDSRSLFYMARSLRINLSRLKVDKKRRYDHRKWETLGLRRSLLSKTEFQHLHGAEAAARAIEWTRRRFKNPWLSPERLTFILQRPFLRDVLTWDRQGRLEAFALVVRGAFGAHYWFVFYNPDPGEGSLQGHGFLLDFLNWARSESVPFAYLGTAYGSRSSYKSRGLSGAEFWDGNAWQADKARLQCLQEGDDSAD